MAANDGCSPGADNDGLRGLLGITSSQENRYNTLYKVDGTARLPGIPVWENPTGGVMCTEDLIQWAIAKFNRR